MFVLDELLKTGTILREAGCLIASDGNFSARTSEGMVVITVSGSEKRNLCAESFVSLSLADEFPAGGSSEWPMHRAIYQNRSDVACVLHTHAPYLTTFAVAHRIPNVNLLAEAIAAIGDIILVPYKKPGSSELSESVIRSSRTAKVYLLANHGVVVIGCSVRDALHRHERAEHLARIEIQSYALGAAVSLTDDQIMLLQS